VRRQAMDGRKMRGFRLRRPPARRG
jgi:hypothetical protein